MMGCEQLERDGADVTANDNGPPPASIRALSVVPPRSEHHVLRYTKHALVHPSNLILPVVATMIGVIHLSLILPLTMLLSAEVLFLAIVPRLHAFQRFVDAKLDRAERAVAAEARAALLLQMGAEHRKELERLERLVDRIRDAVEAGGRALEFAADDCLNLVASYVRLAIAYNATKECLATTDRLALEHEIRSLEAAAPTMPQQAGELAQRRLAIARRRAQRWDRSREELEVMTQQLAMIGALIHLRHEQCGAPRDARGTTAEIDRLMHEIDDSESTLREITELVARENVVEARVLDLGRNVARPLRP